MASINDLFPSKYLAKSDFPAPLVLTIERLGKAEMNENGGKVMNNVVYFVGIAKPMVLKRINATAIAEIHGDDPTAWSGKRVEVYTDSSVMMGAKRVGGLRVRAPSAGAVSALPGSTTSGLVPTPAPLAGAVELWDLSDGTKAGTRAGQTTAQVIDYLDNLMGGSQPMPVIKVRPSGGGLAVMADVWMSQHAPSPAAADETVPW